MGLFPDMVMTTPKKWHEQGRVEFFFGGICPPYNTEDGSESEAIPSRGPITVQFSLSLSPSLPLSPVHQVGLEAVTGLSSGPQQK